jgi:hypothetical protein
MQKIECSYSLQKLDHSRTRDGFLIHNMGAMIHITITRPPTTFAAAHQGVRRGDPIYAICAQSKVMGNSPRPDATPN